ncbi:hypothetical protein FOMPIDRAFT_1052632 [Fomitopsis schrenkii]|uniref:Uncharacterized protein n=1 Tax=Fomitopsis schrenkii TaxID=2126942 RepID=S8DVR2_FOMSC|nr:hypothetical protein FOMPIDRAFT_1052632 [Fomitopsis schrenkii]
MRVTSFLALACAAALPVMASSHDYEGGHHHAHELGDFGEHHLDVEHHPLAMHHLHGEYPIDHHGHYHGHAHTFHHPHHYGHHHGHHRHHHHHHSGYLHGYHPTHFRHHKPEHFHHPHHPTYHFGHHHENHHHQHYHDDEHPSHSHGHEDYHHVLKVQDGESFEHFRPHYFRALAARGSNPCANSKVLARLQAQDGLDPATKVTCKGKSVSSTLEPAIGPYFRVSVYSERSAFELPPADEPKPGLPSEDDSVGTDTPVFDHAQAAVGIDVAHILDNNTPIELARWAVPPNALDTEEHREILYPVPSRGYLAPSFSTALPSSEDSWPAHVPFSRHVDSGLRFTPSPQCFVAPSPDDAGDLPPAYTED